jgi:hypothetical protein
VIRVTWTGAAGELIPDPGTKNSSNAIMPETPAKYPQKLAFTLAGSSLCNRVLIRTRIPVELIAQQCGLSLHDTALTVQGGA